MLRPRILADLIVVFHACYVGFVVLGLVAILAGIVFRWSWVRNISFRVIHLAMIAIVVGEAIAGIPCPLTVWEKQLRVKAGQASYTGDFLGYWAHRLDLLPRRAVGLHARLLTVRTGCRGGLRPGPAQVAGPDQGTRGRTAMRFFTIGYGGRAPHDFLALLDQHQVARLSMSGFGPTAPAWVHIPGPDRRTRGWRSSLPTVESPTIRSWSWATSSWNWKTGGRPIASCFSTAVTC